MKDIWKNKCKLITFSEHGVQSGTSQNLSFTSCEYTVQRVSMRHLAKFRMIGQTVAEIWRFLDFSKCRPSAMMDLLPTCLDNPQRVFGSIYHSAKFGWNRCSIFNNMQVVIFNEFGFKILIHAPKWRFFWDLTA